MKKVLFTIGWLALVSLLWVGCKRSTIQHRCCKNNYEIITQYYHVPDSFQLSIPQVFTPNGDGLNDEFFPVGVGWKVEHMLVKRGTKRVFESYDYLEAVWDGGTQPDGQYKYEMTFRTDVGDIMEVKGDVCIMRYGQRGDKLPELERVKICDCTTLDMIDSGKGVIYETKECPSTNKLQ